MFLCKVSEIHSLTMNRIRLIHWNADEAAERIEQLRAAEKTWSGLLFTRRKS